MPYTTVGGEHIFYTYHPSATPRAPQLILVHGAGGSHQHWGQAVRSADAASTYALDLPGHGRSGGAGRRSIGDYAALLMGFMDSLQLQQVVATGHSMGGAIAMMMALEYPERLAGLVLVGTGARLRVLPAILEGTISDFEDTIKLICRYAYGIDTARQLVRRGQQQMLEVAPQIIHDDFAACDAFDVMERLGEIRCPTAVICGTDDRMTPPKYSEYLVERIDKAELTLIAGAGHMVMVERPDLVADAIQSSLGRWKL
jgi:pimeloyl-ACP methyl ester carboxylesterase